MSVESRLQAEIIKWLRSKGCYVIKCQVPPAPTGCPDVFAVYEGLWIAVEVKASKKSRFQPLQRETVDKLDRWSWCKVVYPENWQEIKEELEVML